MLVGDLPIDTGLVLQPLVVVMHEAWHGLTGFLLASVEKQVCDPELVQGIDPGCLVRGGAYEWSWMHGMLF